MTTPVIVITGGSRGIGAATARLAAKQGYAVCVTYCEKKSEADSVLQTINHSGGKSLAVKVDTSKPQDIENLFLTVDDELGPVTALVNNAGISGGRMNFMDLPLETLRHVLDVNVVGYFLCAQQAAARMAKSRGGNGGVMVNVSSQAAITGGYRLAHYAASKGAINTLTVSLAAELASESIRVNTVSPGIIDTDQRNDTSPEKLQQMKNSIPMGRFGTADEVAKTILWLLSDNASYVTGANIPVTGGR